MKFKRLLMGALACVSAVMLLAGCGGGENSAQKEETGETAKYTIGVGQFVQHEALDAATQGFKDALKEKLRYDVTFTDQNASGDSATCATIMNQFVSAKCDLIFANATPMLQAASSATTEIPIVGTSVTDYATALDIKDWKGTTGVNITGTSDLAPLEEQAKMFEELLPDAKKVGLIYCSSEANSKYQIDIVKENLTQMGFECKEYPFADSNDVANVVREASDNSDALYIPTDNTAASNAEIIASVAEDTPIIAGEEGICKACGLATLSISYYDLGKISGEMAYEILVNNADPSAMEIQYATALTKKYVPERAEKFGIKVSDDYEEIVLD